MPNHRAYIAGIKFHPGARERLERLSQDAELQLEAEPSNKFDRYAVKILAERFHVGYVPHELSREVSELLAAGRIERVSRTSVSGIAIHYQEKEST